MSPPSRDSLHRRRFLQALGATGLVVQGSLWGLSAGCRRDREDTGDEDEIFYFAVITDTHVQADADHINNEVLAETLAILEDFEVPLEFVVITGDLVDVLPSDDPQHYQENDDTALHLLRDLLAGTALPVYPVLGNHDYYTTGDDGEYTTGDFAAREALYLELLDMPDPWYVFEHGGVRFICLNSMQPDDRVDWTPGSCGSFGEEQLAWLEEQLAGDTPCFLFFHHPLATDILVEVGISYMYPFEVPRAEGDYDKYEGSAYEGWTDPIYDLLEEHASRILAVFVGHGHWFAEDTWADIPVMMGDSVGNSVQQTTLEDEDEPMRYHVVACNLTQGTFTIYNRSWFEYNV